MRQYFAERRLAELRRIYLLGCSVNKGKKKGRDPYSRTPASLPHPLARGKGPYLVL